MKIAFIGGGNMATALIGGLLANKGTDHTIHVADPNEAARNLLENLWPVKTFSHAVAAIEGVDAIVLAVKPQILPAVLEDISQTVAKGQLLISIVAGIPVDQMAAKLVPDTAIIRTMPNTPALIGLGITALFANTHCSTAHKELAQKLMESAGETVWLDQESQIDVVTAVSGSGPAYFFYLIEAMQNAGTRLGLPAGVAGKLAIHTAYGASAMAMQSEYNVVELRHRVTSKGGTTAAAIDSMQTAKFAEVVDMAIEAAVRRGQALAGGGKDQ